MLETKNNFLEIEKKIVEKIAIKEISNYYQLEEIEIKKIELLGGMTNRNYYVNTKIGNYVLRIPGACTEEIINRVSEKNNAMKAATLKIDKEVIYFSSKTGIKISKYVENGESLNPLSAKSEKNMILVTEILKKLHSSKLEFLEEFNPFNEIKKYENLLENKEHLYKKYKSYKKVREIIFTFIDILEKNGKILTACHNDTVPENFIKTSEEIYLIDWEYSGMNDPMWDLAAHILECGYSKEEEEKFIRYYFKDKKDILKEKIRIKIYKLLQDFLWSIWTVLKEEKGENFGSYGEERFARLLKQLKKDMNYEL